MVEIKEQELRKAAAMALNQSHKSGKQLVATLNDVDTSAPLVKIISSLGPFIELADKMALVRFADLLIICSSRPNDRQLHPYVNIAWQVTSLVIKVSSLQYRQVMKPLMAFRSDSERPDRS